MKRTLALAFAILLLATLGPAEPSYTTVAVTGTAATETLPAGTRSVLIINDGTDTVYYRLFTNCDTQGDATVSNIPIQQDEFKEYQYNPDSTDACGPSGHYAALSFISSGTASVRLESK